MLHVLYTSAIADQLQAAVGRCVLQSTCGTAVLQAVKTAGQRDGSVDMQATTAGRNRQRCNGYYFCARSLKRPHIYVDPRGSLVPSAVADACVTHDA